MKIKQKFLVKTFLDLYTEGIFFWDYKKKYANFFYLDIWGGKVSDIKKIFGYFFMSMMNYFSFDYFCSCIKKILQALDLIPEALAFFFYLCKIFCLEYKIKNFKIHFGNLIQEVLK